MKYLLLLSFLSSSLVAQETCTIRYEDSPQYNDKLILLKDENKSCKRQLSQRPTGSEMSNVLFSFGGLLVGVAIGIMVSRPKQ